jgi:glycerate-2-kinase
MQDQDRSNGHDCRPDAVRIWSAGVDAVRGERVVRNHVHVDGQYANFGKLRLDLSDFDRICVVGAGKAGASMSLGLEAALGDEVLTRCQVAGWVNVPAGCHAPLHRIHLHVARPLSQNEPTEAGVFGSRKIWQLVSSLGPRDLCVGLFSGGGSALLPLPAEGVSLDEKVRVTRHLSAKGANIWQLNAVRKRLSQIKGGGLARACKARYFVSLIISDVLGDPLSVIASGPTVTTDDESSPGLSVEGVARQFGLDQIVSRTVWELLLRPPARSSGELACQVHNHVIANNEMAVEAAGRKATELGYACEILPSEAADCSAERVGRELFRRCRQSLESNDARTCLIGGGEPIVRLLPADRRGKGGRNQQVALAALVESMECGLTADRLEGITILSGGTDGEDGPTDAAGAIVDATTIRQWQTAGDRLSSPRCYLDRNDAYTFFSELDSLLITGPTNTNVCDLRVAIVVPHPHAIPGVLR